MKQGLESGTERQVAAAGLSTANRVAARSAGPLRRERNDSKESASAEKGRDGCFYGFFHTGIKGYGGRD